LLATADTDATPDRGEAGFQTAFAVALTEPTPDRDADDRSSLVATNTALLNAVAVPVGVIRFVALAVTELTALRDACPTCNEDVIALTVATPVIEDALPAM